MVARGAVALKVEWHPSFQSTPVQRLKDVELESRAIHSRGDFLGMLKFCHNKSKELALELLGVPLEQLLTTITYRTPSRPAPSRCRPTASDAARPFKCESWNGGAATPAVTWR